MPRRVHTRNAIVLLGVFVLLLAVVVVLHHLNAPRSSQVLLTRAKIAQRQGNDAHAVAYLQQYLARVPGDADALRRLGFLLARSGDAGDRGRASSTLLRALQLDPHQDDSRRLLAELLLDGEDYEEAERHIALLLADLPGDRSTLRLQVRMLIGRRDYRKAAAVYRELVEGDTSDVESHVQLADLLRIRLGQSEEADRVMEQLRRDNPQSVPAMLAYAEYQQRQGKKAAAAEALARAGSIRPGACEVTLTAARIAREQGNLKLAKEMLERGLREHPDRPELHKLLALVILEAGKRQEALQALRESVRAVPESAELRVALADLILQEGRLQEADAVLAAGRAATNSSAADTRLLEAMRLMETGQHRQAAAILRTMESSLRSSPEQLSRVEVYLGRCSEQFGDADAALGHYRKAVNADPRSVAARANLAAHLVQTGLFQEAIPEYEQLVELSGVRPVDWLAYARLLLLLPPDPKQLQHREELVENALVRAEKGGATAVELALLRSLRLSRQERWAEAESLLEKATRDHPRAFPLWVALAESAREQGKTGEVDSYLAEGKRHGGGTSEEDRRMLIRFWSDGSRAEAAQKVAALLPSAGGLSEPERGRVLAAAAVAFDHLGRPTEARNAWEEAARLRPEDLRLRLAWFEHALTQSDRALLARLVEEMQQIEGDDGTLWRSADAARRILLCRMGERGQAGEARRVLDELRDRRPGWSRVSLLAAQLAELDGDRLKAMRAYVEAIELGEHRPSVIRRAAQMLQEMGHGAEADSLLQRLPS